MKTKKKIGLLLMVCLSGLFQVQANLFAMTADDDFVVENGVLTAYNGSGGDVVIPDDMGITAIGDYVFQNRGDITSVTIPERVLSIGDYAFSGTGLFSITIPDSVKSIGQWAFGYCNGFVSITIPNSVVSIGDCAFFNSMSLASIIISNSVTSIGNSTFAHCYALSSVVIPDSVVSIGERAFYNCGLISIAIPDSLTSIGNQAFYACQGLTSVIIPNSVTSIGDQAFAHCENLQNITVQWPTPLSIPANVFERVNKRTCTLTIPEGTQDAYLAADVWKYFLNNSDFEIDNNVLIGYYGAGGDVVIPDGVTMIGNSVFQYKFSITSVIIPNSVTSIGRTAFHNCGLISITIPDSVTSIGESAFAACYGLSSVTIPKSVTSIGEGAFSDCTNLQEITVEWLTPLNIPANVFERVNKRGCTLNVPDGTLEAYKAADVWKVFFDDSDFEIDNSGVLTGYYGAGGDVVIPDGVTAIGFGVFQSNNAITSVIISNSVSSIGNYAFSSCTNLTSVVIPDSVTSIGRAAFASCNLLPSITIPNSVTSIGLEAFAWCENLQNITVQWSMPLNITASVFQGVNKRTCTLNVPDGTLEAYKATDIWKGFFNDSDFEIDNNDVLIGYYGAGGDVVIPDGVTAIEYRVFWNNNTITSVIISNSVTSIKSEAFASCNHLASVTIPSSVASIGNYAFGWCYDLRNITVEWSTPLTIPAYVFDVFSGVDKNVCLLHVPAGTKALYQSADVWKDFKLILAEGESPCDSPIASGATGNLSWKLCIDGTLTISGTGAMPDYDWNTFPWYDFRENIIAVDIQTGVTSIGNSAFAGCYHLASVTIPNSVESIENNAFGWCYNLASVTIPNSVISIGDYAFGDCTNLQEITVEWSAPLSIPAHVFQRVNKRTCTLTIPDGTFGAYLAADVWKYFLNNSDFEIDNSGVLIGYYGAGGDVVIPDGVTVIGDRVFNNNSSITSVVISNLVTSIDYSAFGYCTNLSSIDIPAGVTFIGYYAFENCSGLRDVTVRWGNPLVIESYVFNGVAINNCTLHVPVGTKSLYEAADVWKNFGTIIDDIVLPTIAVTGVSLNKTATGLLTGATEQLTATVLPTNASNKNVTWSSSDPAVATVSESGLVTAVSEGSAYVSATTEDGNFADSCVVTVTPDFEVVDGVLVAYHGAGGDVVIPDTLGITAIGDYVFQNREDITSVTIPNSVISIGEAAFSQCDGLTSITVHWDNPLVIDLSVFGSVAINNCTLHVPAGTKSLYEAADVWKDFGTIVEQAPPTVAVTSVSLNKTITGLLIGATEQLTATVLPEDATNKNVTWSSSNEAIASVSATGLVTALAEGAATITVTTEDGGFTATCTVTVTRPLSSDATLSHLAVNAGTLTPQFSPNTTGYTVVVENSVESIAITATKNHAAATVSGAGTHSLSVGENTFNITVTAEDETQRIYTIKVTREAVTTVAVTSVSLDRTEANLLIGETEQLTATVLPEDATNKNVTWSSSNEAIASVSATGLVTALAEGAATITVTTEDGGFTATCIVTVARPLSSDATLSHLAVNAGTLTPQFSPNTTNYTVVVENSTESIVITATKNHAAATMSGAGTHLLSVGENTFDITVTAEDETQRIYTITVTREVVTTVAVTSVSLDRTEANLLIGETEQLTATVLPEDATNKNVTWSSGNEAIASVSATGLVTALAEGVATITVTTEDGGFTATCTVTVARPLSSDATLSHLAVNAGTLTPQFSPNITNYTVVVENPVESITITVTKNHAAATVSGDGTKSLSVGENTFDITVTAEDESQRIYTITVTRETPAVEVNETEPAGANGTGKFELSLTVPANVLFSGSFTLTLPNGFHLDLSQTKLSDDLSGQLTLTFTQNADGSWLFTIGVKEGLRNKTDNVYQKLVDIVYTIDESIDNGNYEAHIQDLSFVFEDNTRIEEAEIPVNVTVDHSYTNIPSVSASVQVYVYKQILYVDTPLAERVSIYSMTGKLLYNIEKPAGKISFSVNRPERILIVKGSSGWVQKVIL